MNAHIVKSACLAAIAASLATSSPAWAEDVKGSKDHPALTRFEGAEIRAYEHKDFDEAVMPDRPIPREAEAKGLELEGKLTPHLLPHRRQEIGAGGLPQLSGRVAGRRFQDLFECKGDEQCGGDFQSFVINGGKVRQPGQGDATFGGKYYVVLAKKEAPVFLDVMEDGSNHITPVFQQVLETKPMQTGQVQVLDMAAMQKSLAESGRVAVYGVYFDTDKAEVKPESKAALDEMGKLLNANPNLKVCVVGHTDNQGTLAGNLDLSQKRARRRGQALESATRFQPRACRRGVASLAPVAANDAEAGRAKNRRVSWSASDDTPPRHGPVIKTPEPRGFGALLAARGARAQAASSWRSTKGRMPAVLVVIHLDRRVSMRSSTVTSCLGTVLAGDRQRHVLHRLDAVFQAGDVVGFSPVMPSDCTLSLPLNCSGSAHADQVAAVDALELRVITAFTPSSWVPLAAQSRDEPVPYSSPPNTTVGVPAATYFMAAS